MNNGEVGKCDRPDGGKCWFEMRDSTDKIFLHKRKGPLSVDRMEMAHVTAVTVWKPLLLR